MIYERWLHIARKQGQQMALHDLSTGESWTFSALSQRVSDSSPSGEPMIHPQGNSARFIVDVLRAWRSQSIVCPLEPDQKPMPVPVPPAPCCHLKTTSATTGAPRTIAFTGEQLAADAENIVATMGLRPDWPNLGVISMAHSYGFSNLVLPLLLHGIPLILVPSPLPEVLRRAASLAPTVTIAAVPILWRTWHETNAIPSNARLAISAGAPLPIGLERAVFETSGLKIHNFYGSSECGGIAYDTTVTPRTDDSCVGSPMHQVALTLNETGCLRIHSQAVGQTYWPDPDEALQAGHFQTSDLAELKNGLVFLRGRVGDQINVAGRKVLPETIERALREHAQVVECVVFGVPSKESVRVENIVACVNVREPIDAVELQRFLLEILPSWQVPRDWWFVSSLTPNQRGKISRADWRRRYLLERKDGSEGSIQPS